MKKIILSLIILAFWVLSFGRAFWVSELDSINYKKQIAKNETLKIDLSPLQKELAKINETEDIFFEWNIAWAKPRQWNIFERKFEKIWIKKISLVAYLLENWEKKELLKKDLEIFVYEKSIPFIIDSSLWDKEITSFTQDVAKSSWVYVYEIAKLEQREIEIKNFLISINTYNNNMKANGDYIWVWWDRDFLFSILSKLNREISLSDSKQKLNMVLISPYNISVVDSYINNFLSNKTWIKKIILSSEMTRFQIIKNPESIDALENNLKDNNFEFIKLSWEKKVSSLAFMSKFVNNLSLKGFSSKSIYLILIIPFLFTFLSFIKHFIWLSPMWIIIPILSTILLFKIWLTASTILLLVIFATNICISKIISKYNLLYTPKIAFIMIINIIAFMLVSNLLFGYNIMNSNISDMIFIIIFIIVAERFITIVIWKEFREYRFHLINTIIFMLLSYVFFSSNFINIILLAYPEIILALIPINFMIWRFSWLRVTEYFRFKEIIKNIEE